MWRLYLCTKFDQLDMSWRRPWQLAFEVDYAPNRHSPCDDSSLMHNDQYDHKFDKRREVVDPREEPAAIKFLFSAWDCL